MLECTNVILSSRCNENNHSVQVQREDKTITPRMIPSAANNETSLSKEIRELNLGVGDKRVNVCTYEGQVKIDIREFLKGDTAYLKKYIYLMDENDSLSEYIKILLGYNRTNGAVYSKINFEVVIYSAL